VGRADRPSAFVCAVLPTIPSQAVSNHKRWKLYHHGKLTRSHIWVRILPDTTTRGSGGGTRLHSNAVRVSASRPLTPRDARPRPVRYELLTTLPLALSMCGRPSCRSLIRSSLGRARPCPRSLCLRLLHEARPRPRASRVTIPRPRRPSSSFRARYLRGSWTRSRRAKSSPDAYSDMTFLLI
jgi:hypothetical protein